MLACKVSGQVVNEEDFEVNRDIHGLHGGPNRGRALAAAKVQQVVSSSTTG